MVDSEIQVESIVFHTFPRIVRSQQSMPILPTVIDVCKYEEGSTGLNSLIC